ncbi:hypothetical protein [Blastococcus sp. CT_GayMR16]|uniref:hypothetical protein n=1 Tax=Blastococcus sp. CT_GayMR16 TaxID=2559607 RepID=UPI00107396A8|nr:hypothetical protein [Blastococcus sp. CT_GayMR16]TFV89963.1 hypothetical protein E4P38_05830 [Blastococcus sp. CT_GayMR16]
MATRKRRWAVALTGAAALLVSGCGSLGADEVESVAATFAGAEDDPAARCQLLAANVVEALVEGEGASCEDAIADLPVGSGDVTAVEVWGEEAQARLTDDTVFLTRTADGWKVTAAACRSQGAGLPYTCQVEGS